MARTYEHGVRPRVLLVDDNDAVREKWERLLRAHGFIVECARNLDEAGKAVAATVPDVVITDMLLPGADIVAWLATLRARPAIARPSLIAMTTEWTPEMRERAQAAGVSACVEKDGAPFQMLAGIYDALAEWD